MASNKTIKQEFAKKYFTIEEAERFLPKIKKILKRTIKLNKALELLSSIEIEVYDEDYENLKKVTKINKQFHKLSYEFYANIEKIEDMGCMITDLEIGIVDFQHKSHGKDILLCWNLGEKRIRCWHELDSDCAFRKPILNLNRAGRF